MTTTLPPIRPARSCAHSYPGTRTSDDGKSALISLLGRAVASDSVRLAVLDILEPIVGPEDADELARINTGQRAQVLGRAIEVLAATACATAMFALRTVYSEREDSGSAAERLADDLEALLPEALAVRTALDKQHHAPETSGLDPRETLFCLLALSSAEQTQLAHAPSGRSLIGLAQDSAPELDARLREEAAGGSSLGRFHARLRDALLQFVLVTDVSDVRLRERALENVFRREDLTDIDELLLQLPDPALRSYAERALTRANRKSRPDRAALALQVIRDREALRIALADQAHDSLDDPSIDVRVGAASMLLPDIEGLDPARRKRILDVYEALPSRAREALASEIDLATLSAGDRPPSLDGLLTWIRASPDADLTRRLRLSLDVWPEAVASTARRRRGDRRRWARRSRESQRTIETKLAWR